jgi:hypothetical protein
MMSLVIVERRFDSPEDFDTLQAIEEANGWCLEARSVKFVRSFFSLDRKLMHCIYEAPDAESVREAQHEAGMPFAKIWAVTEISS